MLLASSWRTVAYTVIATLLVLLLLGLVLPAPQPKTAERFADNKDSGTTTTTTYADRLVVLEAIGKLHDGTDDGAKRARSVLTERVLADPALVTKLAAALNKDASQEMLRRISDELVGGAADKQEPPAPPPIEGMQVEKMTAALQAAQRNVGRVLEDLQGRLMGQKVEGEAKESKDSKKEEHFAVSGVEHNLPLFASW
jgi:hypothetical protein